MISRYIALCGAPGVGKTTVADYLGVTFGADQIDDGACLRQASLILFGGTWACYNTQEGKARSKVICGKSYTNRQLLGQLGNLLEGHFGDQFMPEYAMQVAARIDENRPPPFFVFPSVRKNQGITYRNHGGLVIEITRPGHVPINDFDHYDQSLVTHTIVNDSTEAELLARVRDLFTGQLGFTTQRDYP